MTTLYRFFSFLAGIKFAICLITLLALYVIFGTFLESFTQSHRYAASLSYHHPFFILLLIGFFINILFSALKRYPYKLKHIPFLITHLGLLMVILGTMIKSLFGLQGSMEIYEGSEKKEILISDSKALYIEKRILNPGYASSSISATIPINPNFKLSIPSAFPELDLTILEYRPHAIPQYNSWVKGNLAYIHGLEPIPVINQKTIQNLKEEGYSLLALGKKVRLFSGDNPWNLFAFSIEESDRPFILEQLKKIASESNPSIALIKTNESKDYFIKVDKFGHIQEEIFHSQLEQLKSVAMYDQGFEGYAVSSTIPFLPQDEALLPLTPTFIHLECPLTCSFQVKEPSLKLEENMPVVTLRAILKDPNNHKQNQNISLGYDLKANNLKWPIFGGQYLIRFQPLTIKIPYQVRVRDARQISYPQMNQAYSYECDVIITKVPARENFENSSLVKLDLSSKLQDQRIETTLSMNRVYETWDGYRFYLANITPLDEIDVQRVILIVNYDPAKYVLTYPGAILVGLGVLLLFWLRPYKKPGSANRKV